MDKIDEWNVCMNQSMNDCLSAISQICLILPYPALRGMDEIEWINRLMKEWRNGKLDEWMNEWMNELIN